MQEESGSPFEGLLLTEDKGAHRGSFIWGTWVTWRVDWPTDCPVPPSLENFRPWCVKKSNSEVFIVFKQTNGGEDHVTCKLTNDRLVEESYDLHTDQWQASWGVTWPAHWPLKGWLRSHVTCTLNSTCWVEESRDLHTDQWQADWGVTWPAN